MYPYCVFLTSRNVSVGSYTLCAGLANGHLAIYEEYLISVSPLLSPPPTLLSFSALSLSPGLPLFSYLPSFLPFYSSLSLLSPSLPFYSSLSLLSLPPLLFISLLLSLPPLLFISFLLSLPIPFSPPPSLSYYSADHIHVCYICTCMYKYMYM